ncbi:MAG TPA: cobalt-precorrin 5A hydrolase [Candidatus Manganitrophaceae bacterium]|nr:cobalt-precorrin 5A hydrolase [Candidatus Manganitrophaceae bacterium]
MEKIAAITITRQGIEIGRKILDKYPSARLYLSTKYGAPAGPRETGFDGVMKNLLAEIYPRYDGLIFIMAAGIVVRTILDYVKDKKVDPAVLVVDIKGTFVISLLSGHLGGANRLAREVAGWIGATPVITTGTDVNETIAPDLIAVEIGGEIDDFETMKRVSALLVDNQKVAVLNLTALTVKSLSSGLKENVLLCESLKNLNGAGAEGAIVITEKILTEQEVGPPAVCFIRPKTLIVGVGCNRGTPADEFEAIFTILEERRLSPKSVRSLATIDLKKDEAGLLEFAERRKLPIRFFSREEIDALGTPPNPSETVERYVGVKGVAEPAALLASGGKLVIEKVKRGNITVAVAKAE